MHSLRLNILNSGLNTIGCCYQADNGAGCDRETILSDGDNLYNAWYQGLDNCDSKYSQLDNTPLICVAKESKVFLFNRGINKILLKVFLAKVQLLGLN